jgi:hypothetical protein
VVFGKVAVVLFHMLYVDVVKPHGTSGGQQHDIQNRRCGMDMPNQGAGWKSWVAWRGFHAHSMRATLITGLGTVDSGKRKTDGREGAAASAATTATSRKVHHRQRIWGCVSVAAASFVVSQFYYYFVVRLRVGCLTFLLLG